MAQKKGYSKRAHHLEFAIPSAPTPKHLDKYEIEDAARTMKKHQEIKANPKLHRAAKKHLAKEVALAHRAMKGK